MYLGGMVDEARTEDLFGRQFHIELGIYLPRVGSARIEDSILATEEAYELLSDSGKNLVV